MVGRIIFGLVGITGGIAMMVYAKQLVANFTGPIPFAERFLGSGESTSFLRLAGALIAVISMLIMFGIGGFIYDAITAGLKGIVKEQ